MPSRSYQSLSELSSINRRQFLKIGAAGSAGLVLGNPAHWAQAQDSTPPKTNIDDALSVPKHSLSVPGVCPGKVVEIHSPEAMKNGQFQADVIAEMIQRGITNLTGKDMKASYELLFKPTDVVGIKVNPVGPGLISTRLEVVNAIIDWLETNGLPRNQIVIWDRFDYMLTDAGFTPERFPGVRIEGLQTMDEAAAGGETDDNSRWLTADGKHVSEAKFDPDVYYWADVEAPQDNPYLNQHVFNGQYSYFGKLLTQEITKIINVPVFKNTGNGISMATKNLGYGSICNTGRLHRPLFFNVCTEVIAFPAIRDKLVLNITDGLRAQYDGGPMPVANFTWEYNRLFFATDPFALDMICHNLIMEKRKEMQVNVNEHPRFTEYLRYAEKLELGITNPEKIEHVQVS
ncbi:DUF362 domain-containing protein [candidate division KSB1 bacterium]|nr:DUF362 domain-containing protein [candidate division KSB1 bacterium]